MKFKSIKPTINSINYEIQKIELLMKTSEVQFQDMLKFQLAAALKIKEKIKRG